MAEQVDIDYKLESGSAPAYYTATTSEGSVAHHHGLAWNQFWPDHDLALRCRDHGAKGGQLFAKYTGFRRFEQAYDLPCLPESFLQRMTGVDEDVAAKQRNETDLRPFSPVASDPFLKKTETGNAQLF